MRDWAHSRRLGTSADEASYVVLRQPPASKLANLFRIDVRYHALGLVVTQQLGGRVTVPAVLLALCRLVERKHASTATLQHASVGPDQDELQGRCVVPAAALS